MTSDAIIASSPLHDVVLPVLFVDGNAAETPTLVLLAGVPGSGASRATGRILAQLGENAPAIRINDLRAFYMQTPEPGIDRADSASAASAEWLRGAVRFARESRRSFVLDGPLRTPAVAIATVELFGSHGFDTRVVVVGARRGDALLSLVSEHLRRARDGSVSAPPSAAALDAAIESQRAVLSALESAAPSTPLEVWDQRGNPVHNSAASDSSTVGVLDHLDRAESLPRSTAESVQWLSELRRVTGFAESLATRHPALTAELIELHEIAIRDVIPDLKVNAASRRGSEVTSIQEAGVAARLSELRRALPSRRPEADLAAPVITPAAPSTSGPTR